MLDFEYKTAQNKDRLRYFLYLQKYKIKWQSNAAQSIALGM